ncbi:MAG: N-acetylmuramoyl-L-alanine amidase [Holosporaceae bacterium]|jgi:N-acetyl-anhydromuramyl-L-alanine amidase AmpD|nr:N-acetylmuramoyl-L-alanine amidase [Holosporaceae bacterium]
MLKSCTAAKNTINHYFVHKIKRSQIKKYIFVLFIAIVSVGSLFSMRIEVVRRHLDNTDCLRGVTHRLWREAWQQAKFQDREELAYEFIVWHYTVCRDLLSTYMTYNRHGVSAHYTIENCGTICLTVDPDKFIAYHAGVSIFRDRTNLNCYSIGIENINPGFVEMYQEVSPFGRPVQIYGDGRWWYLFSEQQFVSSVTLTAYLQEKYKISGWDVVTHADIAIGRKSDVGPMWDYRRAYREFNAGYWPEETHRVNVDSFGSLSDSDYIALISSFGYHMPEDHDAQAKLIRAYQMHFSTVNISGELVSSTKKRILEHVIGLMGHIDPITRQKYEYFHDSFAKWAEENPDKALAFSEYF